MSIRPKPRKESDYYTAEDYYGNLLQAGPNKDEYDKTFFRSPLFANTKWFGKDLGPLKGILGKPKPVTLASTQAFELTTNDDAELVKSKIEVALQIDTKIEEPFSLEPNLDRLKSNF